MFENSRLFDMLGKYFLSTFYFSLRNERDEKRSQRKEKYTFFSIIILVYGLVNPLKKGRKKKSHIKSSTWDCIHCYKLS